MSTTDLEQSNFDSKRALVDDSDDDEDRVYSKRRRTSNDELMDGWWRQSAEIKLSHDDYTVGWICALPIELAASHAMLDKVHKSLPTVDNDTNAYILGSIGGHNVAMACLPSGQYGTNNAATVAGNMMRSFKSIRFGFMVGIGGGVPGEIDIRLGDIVVGTSVIQHDLGKIVEGSGFQGTGTPRIPPQSLLNAISKLRALHEVRDSKVMTFLREMQERYPKLVDYEFPASCQDRLFRITNHHDHSHLGGCSSCSLELCERPSRDNHNPLIHYGAIASGNQVIKCGQRRDELAKERNVICFEMEAAGLSDTFPCVVVRGICDYSDSQKNKEWQRYAAATAAAYAKELILIVASRRPRFKIAEAHASENTLVKAQEALKARRKALLESLRFEQIDARHATIKKAHSKTCEWLLSEELYKQWLDPSHTPDHRGFFWISGKPGAGKSTIMKFALGRAKKAAQKNAGIIYFFFNARGDNLEKSTSGLYRSLLLQLLEKFPDLQTVLDESISTTSEHTSCPTIEEIQALLRNAIAGLGQRQVTCFIDALDECDEIEVRDMVVFFEDLGEEAIANDVQLRICFSSRHYPHIDIRYGLKLILENQSGHSRDLESYVQSHLRAGKGNYVSDIRAKILMKAGGVFMWVVLVVQVLNTEFVRGRRSRVEQRLQEIPAGLSDLFKDILKRDSTNIPDLLLCIQWVLFAKRPLTLKEFHFAMLSGLPELQEKPCVYDSENDTDEDMRLYVTGSSKGLAEITKSTTPTVQFIHESVKDFLVKDDGLGELWPELKGNFEVLSHDRLKTCCHSHVTDGVIGQLQIPSTENLPRANSDEAKVMRQLSVEKFPFLAYATQHLFYHADVAAKDLSQDDFLDQLQLEKWIHASNLLEKYQNHRYQSTASLTYILADKNFPNLLRGYVHRHPVCDVEGERYVYPIFAALANRNWATVNVLLGQADAVLPKEEIFPSANYRKEFDSAKTPKFHPVNWAISTSHYKMAELMIRSRMYDCSRIDGERRSPLHLAALADNAFLTEVLLENLSSVSGKVDHPDSLKDLAVDESAEHKDIPKRASMRAHLNQRDISDQTVLSLACVYLKEDIIRVLLKFGVDFSDSCARITHITNHNKLNKWLAAFLIEKLSWSREKLLTIALKLGNAEVAGLILECQEFIHDAVDFDRGSYLIEAAKNESIATLKVLLDKGVGVGSRPWSASRHFDKAASVGDEGLVKFLIENGASVDDSRGLLEACQAGHTAIVRIFLEHGARTDLSTFYSTPLHAACSGGHVAIVRLLLAKKAQIHITAGFGRTAGRTPLHLAALHGHEAVVRTLVAAGAEIGRLDANKQTPLALASSGGHAAVAKFLADEGALVDAIE